MATATPARLSLYLSLTLLLAVFVSLEFRVDAFVPISIGRQSRLSPPLVVAAKHDTWKRPTGVVPVPRSSSSSTIVLKDTKWDRDIDENSRKKKTTYSGGTETVAGALLGGLVGGPFGALFGASIGSNFGAKNAVDRGRQEEMERMGITQDMLDAARDCGVALERSNEGVRAVRDSLQTQQSFARRLDRDADAMYERAKVAMAESNEKEATKMLFERKGTQDKLKGVLMQCAEEKKRLEKMQSNVEAIERRAMEVEALLQRTVGAKAVQKAGTTLDLGLSLAAEDPLLQKFRDLGID